MKKYINDIMIKNFIQRNNFNFIVLIFTIQKFKNEFWIYVNYKVLNVITIKNYNFSLFLKKILIKFCAIKYYNKFNVIIFFNEVHIRENDELKIIFIIKYDLFKYIVMFFNLYNAFEILWFFINEILRKYLNEFCIIYFNDILIYNNIKKKYIKYVNLMF